MATRGIQLPIPSASKVVYQIIQKSYTNFPNAFSEYQGPEDAKLFAKKYVEYLSQFEIHRATSKERQQIAQFILDDMYNNFLFIEGEKSISFAEYMKKSCDPLPLSVVRYPWMQNNKGYKLAFSYDGKIYNKEEEVLSFVDKLQQENTLSSEAALALKAIAEYAYKNNNGYINLQGKKFVLLGGTAELSPIYALLQAGASVLTTHTRKVEHIIEQAGEFCGELHYASSGMDLLTQTNEISETIRKFAGNDKVHLGILAYRGGKGQELRLSVAQEGILRKIHGCLTSISCYISPSVIAEISEEEAKKALDTYNQPLGVASKTLRKTTKQRWYGSSIAEKDARYWTNTICSFQGCSYAAANLFGKYYVAESYGNENLNVSANVGGITATSSMDTPMLRAAFREAKRFGIDVFEADETRELMQALMFYDLLCKKDNNFGDIFTKQIHGGALSVPWTLNGCVEEAAIRGNIKRFVSLNEQKFINFHVKRLHKGSNKQVVMTRSACIFEKIVCRLSGKLAQAFVGGKSAKPATHLFLGNAAMIPKKVARLLPLLAKSHRFPLIGKSLYNWNRKKKIYGNLLTNMLWPHYKKHDRLVITTDKEGALLSVRIYKRNRQDIEFSINAEGAIEQTIYFGRSLVDGNHFLKMHYSYDPKLGHLKTVGSTSVETKVIDQSMTLSDLELTQQKLAKFKELCGGEAQGSITFPVNSGFLEECLKLLQTPEWGVDFTRVTVFSVCFDKKSSADFATIKQLSAAVTPTKIVQTDKGQIFTSQVSILTEGKCLNEASISLLVRGNTVKGNSEKIPRLEYKNLQGEKLNMLAMNDAQLVDFATLNGDYNPLHQIDGVAQVVGFKRRINPGLGLLSQIESLLRNHLQKDLEKFSGTIVRPAFPNETYTLEFKEQSDRHYLYQLLQPKSNKVLIDGEFVVD